MTNKDSILVATGVVLDEDIRFTLVELSHACEVQCEWVIELVEQGVLEPEGSKPDQWHFPATCLSRTRKARRLQQDLELNLPGVALVLDLLEEIEFLRTRM